MVAKSIVATLRAGLAPVTKAAVTPLSMRDVWGFVSEPFAGAWQRGVVQDDRETILAFSAVFTCVSRIAADIAKLGLWSTSLRSDGTWKPVGAGAPRVQVLRKPNRFQTRIQFLTDWLLSKLIYGNAYILKQRDSRGIVSALFVMDSRRVKALVAPDGSIYYQLSSDNLAGLEQGVTVPASEIIHDRGPTLFHPLCGVSPIFACANSATHGNRIQGNSVRFFENMSRPSGFLTAPSTIDEVTAKRLKQDWEANYSGANVGRLAVLGDGLSYEPMGIQAADAQLIEQLRWTVEDVARAFNVPLHKIGAGPVPTAGNVEALQLQYYGDCLQQHVEAIEALLDDGLELPATMRVEFDLSDLLRMDGAARIAMLVAGSGGAVMTPNEARAAQNLPPLPGGDTVYLQQQNYSLQALSKRDARPDPFAPAPGAKAAANEALVQQALDELLQRLPAADRQRFAGRFVGGYQTKNMSTDGGV